MPQEQQNKKEFVDFLLESDTTDAVKNLSEALIYAMNRKIKEKIEDISERNEKVLDDLNKKLSEAENHVIRELSKIDDVLGVYETNPVTGKKVRHGGKLEEARKKVREIEQKWRSALRRTKPLEKSGHNYQIEKDKLDMMEKSNAKRYYVFEQEEKVEALRPKYEEWQKLLQEADELWDQLQEAKDEVTELERVETSFKTVPKELIEDDRDLPVETNDTLGHYITTHWGAKVKKLKNQIDYVTNLTVDSASPEVVQKFQNAFNQEAAQLLFFACIKILRTETNASFFDNFELSEDQKNEFIEWLMRGMPKNLIDQFNPFLAFLDESAQYNNLKKEVIVNYKSTDYVEIVDDGSGTPKKILDLSKIDPKEVVKMFSAFVTKHFVTACKYAMKEMKRKRATYESEYMESDSDDEHDRQNSKSDRMMDGDGSISTYDFRQNENLDDSTVSYWMDMKSYLFQNINDMAQDALFSMRDNLPDQAFLQKISESAALEETKKIYRKLISYVDREITSSRKIGNLLKEILLQSIGGAGNDKELVIEYNCIYAAFQLYIYKYMIEAEEKSIKKNGKFENSEIYLERLQTKMENAQVMLNDPDLENFSTFKASQKAKVDRKVEFLMDATLTNGKEKSDGSNPKFTDGSGKSNNFIIDGTQFR